MGRIKHLYIPYKDGYMMRKCFWWEGKLRKVQKLKFIPQWEYELIFWR